MRSSRNLAFLIAVMFMLLLHPDSFGFGKNKVNTEKFDWNFVTTRHFQVYYHQNQGVLPEVAAEWAEFMYSSLRKDFKFRHSSKIPLILYSSPNYFQQTNIIMEILPEGVGGFTELFKNRVVVPFNGSYQEFRHVLHHEIVHAFQFGILYDRPASSFMRNSGIQLPLWFAEGLAEFHASEWNVEADMFLMDRTVFSFVPPPGPALSGYMAYKGGQSFMHFLHSVYGAEKFERFLRKFRDSKNVEEALKGTYNLDLEKLGDHWLRELKRIYWPEIGERQDPQRISQSLTSREKEGSHFNLKPRISPDGKKIAYYSDKKDYTRIIIADLKGETIAEISQYGFGGFFETFHPFRSGMCWSPDSKKLAFVTKRNGNDEIRIVDIENKKTVETVDPGLSSVESPDWSHAGRYLVFAGIREDRSDLYLYDLELDTMGQLTDDPLTESDPKFSPDGASILYGGVKKPEYSRNEKTIESSDLFLLDIATRKSMPLLATQDNEKQGSFAGDGRHLLFVSDRNGIDNLYLSHLDSMESARPVTDIIGGISNPDWARDTNMVAFCLFQNQGWDIRTMENPVSRIIDRELKPTLWAQCRRDSTLDFFIPPAPNQYGDSAMATLKDSRRSISRKKDSADTSRTDSAQTVADTSDSASHSLTASADSTEADSLDSASIVISDPKPYRLKFSPDMITFGLGVSSFYGYAGQGVVVLSDIMGNHRITLAGDVNNNIEEYAHIFGSYLSLKNRVNYGIGAFYNRDFTFSAVRNDLFYHDAQTGGFLLSSYPFSLFSRLDLELQYSNIRREPRRLSGFNDTERDTTESTRVFNIMLPQLSLVFDNILWGITGPINGIRSEASLLYSPQFNFVTSPFWAIDLDFRKYFHFAKRFVWANKLSFGASFDLEGNTSPRRYFLGGNENWLFFSIDQANYEKTIDNSFYSKFVVPFRGWDYFALQGSRFAVWNTEFRFPFVRELSVVWPLPVAVRYVTGAVFADFGNAWSEGTETYGLPLPDKVLGGVGFGMRANL